MKSPQSIVKRGRVLVVPDVHVPHVDVRAWNLVLDVIAYIRPDATVQLGDFMDADALSAHPKSFGSKPDFDREVRAVQKEWAKLEAANGNAMLVCTMGNHTTRLMRYVAKNAPVIEGLIPSVKELFGMSEDTIVRPYQETFNIGRVAFVHDLGHSGKHAASQTLDAINKCVVFGHTHRGCVTYSGSTNGERWFALNAGWLGDVSKISYMAPAKTREWSHGFGIVDYREGYAFAQFIPIVKGRCLIDGKVFK